MTNDDAWLRSWFDEQDAGGNDPTAERVGTDPASQDWRHGSRPAGRGRAGRTRLALVLCGLAVVAIGVAAARTSADNLATTAAAAPRDRPQPQLSAAPLASAQPLPAGPLPADAEESAADEPARGEAVAELAVHEHVTTGDGVRWVDAARATAPAEPLVDSSTRVVLVDAVVLDGTQADASDTGTSGAPQWVARRRARYAVPLRCTDVCESAATPWPLPADPPAQPGPTHSVAEALVAAGYRDARVESTTAVAGGLEELTVTARPPGIDGFERVVLWVATDADGTAVVGMP